MLTELTRPTKTGPHLAARSETKYYETQERHVSVPREAGICAMRAGNSKKEVVNKAKQFNVTMNAASWSWK